MTRVLWPDDELDAHADAAPEAGGPGGEEPGRDGRRLLRRALTGTAVVVAGGILAAQVVWVVGLVRASNGVDSPLTAEGVAFADEAVAAPPADTTQEQAQAGTAPARSRMRIWADRLSPQVGIPAVALAAYGSAEVRLAKEDPGCHLSWVALAGIGRIESDHGRFGGAVLGEDGRSTPRIVGVPLDGNGVATITDTDGGALDGDTVHDRAVGPMQFIPSTWRRYAADGDGDGVADPNALPDAALAAGRYLCVAGGGDLRTGPAWTRAVLAYNNSGDYLRKVTDWSNAYVAAASRR